MTAAAVATSSGSGATNSGSAAATATGRFAAACGALISQYVRAAEGERAQAAAAPVPLRPLLPLMPGADVDAAAAAGTSSGQDGEAAEAHQMTIVYGGRVLVLDGVPAGKAAGLLRLAAAAAAAAGQGGTATTEVFVGSAAADLPVARRASLQRFMEKRRVRAAARAAEPYRRPDACPDHLKLAL
ncbi:hypothetical protein BS78_01G236800 [Paspalum vaginatum]|nr:hypothetical protein BS78_01G236800 [Paspalum vaginatum]